MSNVVTQPQPPSLYTYVAYMYIIISPGLSEGDRTYLSDPCNRKSPFEFPLFRSRAIPSSHSLRPSRKPQPCCWSCKCLSQAASPLPVSDRSSAGSRGALHPPALSPFTPSRVLGSWHVALVLSILPNLSLNSREHHSPSIQYRIRSLEYHTLKLSTRKGKGKIWACIQSLVSLIAYEITSEAPISGPYWPPVEAPFHE